VQSDGSVVLDPASLQRLHHPMNATANPVLSLTASGSIPGPLPLHHLCLDLVTSTPSSP
jgi:hypothetical protein